MIINIDPVAFYFPAPVVGWWPVYWYGISWLVAILGVNFAAKRIGKVSGRMSPAQAEDYLTYGILGAILGGRIGYMVFAAHNMRDAILNIVNTARQRIEVRPIRADQHRIRD